MRRAECQGRSMPGWCCAGSRRWLCAWIGTARMPAKSPTGPVSNPRSGAAINPVSRIIPVVSKVHSCLVTLFIPSVDRDMQPVDQAHWKRAALEFLGVHFGGATAFPRGEGVWRDDQQGGNLIFDEPIVIHSYTDPDVLEHTI